MEANTHAMMAVTALVLVAAITPGPNNLVVLRAAARSGIAAAAPAIIGIVTGGLVLLGLVAGGAGAAFAAEPRLRTAIAIGGSLYLSWLGLRLMRVRGGRGAGPARSDDVALPAGALALFGFQFLNPKGWMMVLTATAAAPGVAFWHLAALFAIVPAVCLTIWSGFGSAMARHLARPRTAAWFDRAMGALLLASAIALMVEA